MFIQILDSIPLSSKSVTVCFFIFILFIVYLFKQTLGKYWHSMENRKKFFDGFAEKKGFDPLQAENWKSFTQVDFVAHGVWMWRIFYCFYLFLLIKKITFLIGADIIIKVQNFLHCGIVGCISKYWFAPRKLSYQAPYVLIILLL